MAYVMATSESWSRSDVIAYLNDGESTLVEDFTELESGKDND
jgi:hypothetical protein